MRGSIIALVLVGWSVAHGTFQSELYGYERAAGIGENVLRKRFLKSGDFEFSLPSVGFVLNQSYLNSIVIHGSVNYFINERWGLGVDVAYVNNLDKIERTCIENFYNDANDLIAEACALGDDKVSAILDKSGQVRKGANLGPAYVPIRELETLLALTLTWSPIYGKQIAMLSYTGHFDLYSIMGLGVANSKFFPLSDTLRNGKISRDKPVDADEASKEACISRYGACPSEANFDQLIGRNGRPDAILNQATPMFTFGVGQKFHIKSFADLHLKLEFRNYALIDPEGIEYYFALWGG